MRILIVEDDSNKVSRLVGYLESEMSLSRDRNLVVSSTAFDARRAMTGEAFDLLILDIVIPNRAGDSPTQDVAVALIRDLTERTGMKRPKHIVGVTAFEDVLKQVAPIFEERLWTVIQYDPTSNEWLLRIRRCIEYLVGGEVAESSGQQTPANYATDLCVITALTTPEADALHRLPWAWSVAEPLDDVTFYRRGTFRSGERDCTVVSLTSSRMGMVAGALVAAKAIDRFHPRAIAMVGICAGVKGKTQVGDIIMADPSWDYQSGKRVTEAGKSKLQLDTHQIPLQESLRAHAEQMRGNTKLWNDIRTAWVHPVSNVPRLLVGAVASGSAVVADGTLIPDLVDTQQRKLLGVEMEIYGVYAAAAYSNRPKPAVFAMKAVCDFGDEKKDDAHQAYAAYTSANALKGFVEAYFSKLFY